MNSGGLPLPGGMLPYPIVSGGPVVGGPLNTAQFGAPNPALIPGPYFNAGGMARPPNPAFYPSIFPQGVMPTVPPFSVGHQQLHSNGPRMQGPGGVIPSGVPIHHLQGGNVIQQRVPGVQGGPPRPASGLQQVSINGTATTASPATSASSGATSASSASAQTPASTTSEPNGQSVAEAFKLAVAARMASKKGSVPAVTVTDSSTTTAAASVATTTTATTTTSVAISSESTAALNRPHAQAPPAHSSQSVSSTPQNLHHGSSSHATTHITSSHSVAPPQVPQSVPHASTQPRSALSPPVTHTPGSSSEHHTDAHRAPLSLSSHSLHGSSSSQQAQPQPQPTGSDLLAVLRRGDDDDAPAPSSPAPDRFLLARSGGKQNLMMSEVDGLELLERLRVEYAAKHHRAKLTYTLSVLRDIKENIRHELTSALFPQGMKSHKLLPVGGRKVITEDDPISKAKKFFTSILNKLSRDNYNKLVVDLIKYDIKSQEMLTAIINTVFDKALEDLKYQDIYADLCKLLGDKAQEWSKNYLRVNELDDKQAPAGPGWYYDLSGGLSIQDGEWQGPFPSKDEAQDKGFRISNFKRLILNRCQIEFYREDQNLTAQEEEQDEAQKAARGTSMTAAEIEEFRVRALRRKEVRKANKKRMLSNIAFIGQLYMTGMLTSTILYMCCGKLLNAGKTPESYVPDPDDIEALCRLLTLSGGKLEIEEKNKQKEGKESEKMSPLFSLLQQIIDAHPKLESRSRFLVKDLFDLRANKWELTGSASTIERQAKTVTLAEAKALILKEEEAEKSKLMSFVDSGSKGSYNNAGLGTSARQQVMRGDSRSGNGGGGGGGGGGGRSDQGNNPQDLRNQQRRSGPASTLGHRGKGPVASANPATSEGSSEQDSWQTVPLKGGKVLSQSSRDDKASISTTPVGSIQSPPSTPSSSSSESVLSPTAPASLVLKTVVLSGDALLKHVSSVLLEFCRIMDADELIRSVTEVSSSLNYARILVQGAFIDAVKSDVARNNAGKAIVTLASKGLVQRENIVAGLASFMMSYADLVSDAPKISDYTASVSYVLLLFSFFPLASDDRHILTPLVRGLWVYEHKSCLNLSDARNILKNYASQT